MFRFARIKLTLWYLVILTIVSVIFSLAIFRVISVELDRFEHGQRVRLEMQLKSGDLRSSQQRPFVDPSFFDELRERVALILIGINVGIVVVAGGLSYFLAGKTLQPIQEMVEDQRRFISDASHEFRTPLTALKSSIEVNLRDEKLSLKEARELLESNLEEVNELQVLSDALLELTSYEKPNHSYHLENISLSDAIECAMKKMVPLAKQKHIELKKEVDEAQITGDEKSLCELFIILIDNAIKYSPEYSVIEVITKSKDGLLTIWIKDQGMGIEQKDLPRIFDRFYRADKSRTKDKVDGYGLGLAIAQRIVGRHHGSIQVAETSNKGTTFQVNLPILNKEGVHGFRET